MKNDVKGSGIKNRVIVVLMSRCGFRGETLEGFVDCARLCPSSVNKQPLKYFLAWEPEEVGEGAGTDEVGAGVAGDGFAASGKTADGFCCDLSG